MVLRETWIPLPTTQSEFSCSWLGSSLCMWHMCITLFLNPLSLYSSVYMCMDGEVFIGVINWGPSWPAFLKNTDFPFTSTNQLPITFQLQFDFISLFSIHTRILHGLIFCKSCPCTKCSCMHCPCNV